MAAPDLLAGLPLPSGVDWDVDALQSAAQRVRDYCGWHIAPSITETVTVPLVAGYLLLPSLLVTGVTSVDGKADGYTWRSSGGVNVTSGRRTGDVAVTFTHGYDSCPLPVFSAVLQLAKTGLLPEAQLRQKNIGPFQFGYFEQADPMLSAWAYRRLVVA